MTTTTTTPSWWGLLLTALVLGSLLALGTRAWEAEADAQAERGREHAAELAQLLLGDWRECRAGLDTGADEALVAELCGEPPTP